jgi:pimeloyl-ACP methyl ester carboxylesterase
MSKPTFVLLHGAWHSPKCWNRLVEELDKSGYSAVAPAMPSSGSSPPILDWSQDVEIIRNTVSDLINDTGNDIVVVMHSFSGMTGGTALEGLDKESRVSKGLKGGVIRLIYIVAFLVPERFQHSPHGTRDNMVPEMKTDIDVSPNALLQCLIVTYTISNRAVSLPFDLKTQRTCFIKTWMTTWLPNLQRTCVLKVLGPSGAQLRMLPGAMFRQPTFFALEISQVQLLQHSTSSIPQRLERTKSTT